MKNVRKAICYLLCVLLVAALLPAAVLADGTSAEASSQNIDLYLDSPKDVYLTFDSHNYEVFSCALVSGTLPDGLAWTYGAGGVHIYGTPSKEGTATLEFKIVRGDDRSVLYHTVYLSVSKDASSEKLSMTVNVKSDQGLTFDSHNYELFSCELVSGTMPDGLVWSVGAGGVHIYGTPKKAGSATLIFKIVRSDKSVLYHTVYLMVKLDQPDFSFTDVKEGDWFYTAAKYCYEIGLMTGVGNGKFDPGKPTTRAMIVTILYGMENKPAVTAVSPFTDVSYGQWYAAPVIWAATNNIVSGYGNGIFYPNAPISREQFAAILYRYAQYKEISVENTQDLSSFYDNDKISTWAREKVEWAVSKGLLSGVKINGKLCLDPQGRATRAQAAAIIMRFVQNVLGQ